MVVKTHEWSYRFSPFKNITEKTGDGKFDEKDAKALWDRYNSVMTTRLPSASGFAAGFFMGVRR